MKIIGIIGKAGSGKSTFTGMIKTNTIDSGRTCERVAFGDRLKRTVEAMFALPDHAFDDPATKAKNCPTTGCSYGRLLQRIGMAMRYEFSPDIWVKLLFKGIETPDVLIIDDVRFLSEAKAIKDRGGYLIRITRKAEINDGRDPAHVSETEQDMIEEDRVVMNDGGLEQLDDLAAFTFLREIA